MSKNEGGIEDDRAFNGGMRVRENEIFSFWQTGCGIVKN